MDPEFLLDDDFDGVEGNDGGTAKEMLHMIMSGCNIAAEVEAIDEDGVVIEGEGAVGVGVVSVEAVGVQAVGVGVVGVEAKDVEAEDVGVVGVEAEDVEAEDVGVVGVEAEDVGVVGVGVVGVGAEGVGAEGVGEEGVGTEEGVCAMEISGNAVAKGAGDVIPVPSDRVSGSNPEFIQRCGVMKNMKGTWLC